MDALWMLPGIIGVPVAWFTYRWFRPSASQRRMNELAERIDKWSDER